MTGQRRQFAAVDTLIQSKDDDRQPGLVAKAIQQRLEGADVLGRNGDITALIATIPFEQSQVVIAKGARMDLHHQPVVETHPGHLGEHLGPKQLRLLRRGLPGRHTREQALAL